MIETLVDHVTRFVEAHAVWAPLIAGLLAFCESLAIISFLVPATVILVAIGGLIVPAGLSFWLIWAGAATGAILGDWMSYEVGRWFKEPVMKSSAYDRHRDRAERAIAFMHRWGAVGVFIGRFSGPLRAFVPLAAGIIAIPHWLFQVANVSSAVVWAAALLSPGTLIGEWLK